ncbi:hypothetical protein BGZ83_011540 [Gryganskiella cystojenkinii]|nr:hypothetical protein BGZ83_011540 [Gryganskiella cystojenkinii]
MTHQQTIPVHVRYVPKDLWVQVDMPLDISIQQAKDLILTRCRLYSMPPRPVSPVTLPVTSVAASTASTAMTSDEPDELSRGKDLNKSQARHFQMLTRPPEQDEDNCILRHGDLLLANDSGHGGSFEDESFNDDQMSLDDDEAELCAEALMVSEDDDDGDDGGDDKNDVDKVNFHAPSRRSILMVSNPNIGEDLDSGIAVVVPTKLSVTGSGPIIGSAADREIHEHGGLLADCLAAEEEEEEVSRTGSATMNTQSQCPVSELGRESHCLSPELLYARKERCTAWQASFGLFWLAAGHWLDDSRQVGSYPLQSHCVIELQLKSHYIHLPRMARDNDICCQSGAGSDAQSLDYYDHYAEGTLFKKSKQAMIASATSADRERESKDWKERWVVLRGNRLIIYHKRKNTTKKVIDLRPPVSVQTTVLPYPTTRKHTGGSVCSGQRSALSSTMITLTVPSNPATPKIYFRASGTQPLDPDLQFVEQPQPGLPYFDLTLD